MTPGWTFTLRAALQHLDAAPVPGDLHQDAVRYRLAGEAGARGAEGHGDPVSWLSAEQPAHLLDAAGEDHGLRDQPVEAGVRGEGDQVHGPVEHAIRSDDGGEGIPKRKGRGHGNRQEALETRTLRLENLVIWISE